MNHLDDIVTARDHDKSSARTTRHPRSQQLSRPPGYTARMAMEDTQKREDEDRIGQLIDGMSKALAQFDLVFEAVSRTSQQVRMLQSDVGRRLVQIEAKLIELDAKTSSCRKGKL